MPSHFQRSKGYPDPSLDKPKSQMSTRELPPSCTLQRAARDHSVIGRTIIKNPCGVPFITPHGFVFATVRAVASGKPNRAEIRNIPRGTTAFIARIGGV